MSSASTSKTSSSSFNPSKLQCHNILSGNKFVNRYEPLSPMKTDGDDDKSAFAKSILSAVNGDEVSGFDMGGAYAKLEPTYEKSTQSSNKFSNPEPIIADRMTTSSRCFTHDKTKSKFDYIITRINNYIKISEFDSGDDVATIKRLNNFLYNNETYDVEFTELPGLKYDILNPELSILDKCSFLSNENIEEPADLVKHLQNLSEALFYLKGDTGDASGVPDVIRRGLLKKHESIGLRTYPELSSAGEKRKNIRLTSSSINITSQDKTDEPTGVNDSIGDYFSVSDFSKTDFIHGIAGNSPFIMNGNLAADGNILNTYVVLYNQQFFNALVIEKYLYESVIINSDISKYIPEISLVREINLSNEFSLTECQAMLGKQIYYSKDDIIKDLDYFINKSNAEYPSLENIRKYITQTYDIDDNMDNRIQFKNLCDDIFMNLNVAKKYQECVKRSLPMIFSGLGLSKKRYSEGVFWFGIKRRNNTIYKERPNEAEMGRKLTADEMQRLMEIELNARNNIDSRKADYFEKQRILGYAPTI
jgi:hypothetical protein